jgi:hypothetical protein
LYFLFLGRPDQHFYFVRSQRKNRRWTTTELERQDRTCPFASRFYIRNTMTEWNFEESLPDFIAYSTLK